MSDYVSNHLSDELAKSTDQLYDLRDAIETLERRSLDGEPTLAITILQTRLDAVERHHNQLQRIRSDWVPPSELKAHVRAMWKLAGAVKKYVDGPNEAQLGIVQSRLAQVRKPLWLVDESKAKEQPDV